MYRVLVSIPLFQSETLRPRAQIIASMSAAVVNLILIMALGRVYENLAKKMTQWGKSNFKNKQDFFLKMKRPKNVFVQLEKCIVRSFAFESCEKMVCL